MKTNVIFNIQNDTCSLTHVGKIRKNNEDNFGYAETPNGDVFVVCDGMGGHVGGQIASAIAVESIIEFLNKEKKLCITSAMSEAIKLANSNIRRKALEKPELKGMGTTVVLLVIQKDRVYIAHVGDSRIYLLSNHKLYRLTKDHSYVQDMVDNKLITPKEAETHSKKNIITRALGIKADVEPEVEEEPLLLKNGDTLLLCSDGLTDMINDETIESELNKQDSVKEAGKILIDLALQAGGKDNITLQLIRISKSNNKKSIFKNKGYSETQVIVKTKEVSKFNISNKNIDNYEASIFKRIFGKWGKSFFVLIAIAITMGGLFWLLNNGDKDAGNIEKKSPVKKEKQIYALRCNDSTFKDLTNNMDSEKNIDSVLNALPCDSTGFKLVIILSDDKIDSVIQKVGNTLFVVGLNKSSLKLLKEVEDSLMEVQINVYKNDFEKVLKINNGKYNIIKFSTDSTENIANKDSLVTTQPV